MRSQDVKAAFAAFRAARNEDTVDDGEFQRRLAVCKKCPQRKRGVRTVKTRISEVLAVYSNKHKVREEVTKFSCGVCGCSFGLLLPAKPEHLHKDSKEEAAVRPNSCWMNSLK